MLAIYFNSLVKMAFMVMAAIRSAPYVQVTGAAHAKRRMATVLVLLVTKATFALMTALWTVTVCTAS